MLAIISIILGIALLVAGRRLFWLFVAAAGFLAGVQLTLRAWDGPEGTALLVGLGVGILFAVLAIFARAIAIGVAGFLAGGAVLVALAHTLGFESGAATLIIFLVGGIIGVILVGLLFDWALITLSSLAGASLLVQSLDWGPALGGAGFLILVIIGVVFQGSQLRREKKGD